MLRDNTESFAREFTSVLKELGVEEKHHEGGFQLQKFERLEPDVFIWMLSGEQTYVVTIADGGSDAPDERFIADWSGGVKAEDVVPISPINKEFVDKRGLEDDYDFIKIYRLPKGYEHIDFTF